MDTKKATKPVPDGYHAVTPFVIAKGAARFVDFLKEAFAATEIARVTDEHGVIADNRSRESRPRRSMRALKPAPPALGGQRTNTKRIVRMNG